MLCALRYCLQPDIHIIILVLDNENVEISDKRCSQGGTVFRTNSLSTCKIEIVTMICFRRNQHKLKSSLENQTGFERLKHIFSMIAKFLSTWPLTTLPSTAQLKSHDLSLQHISSIVGKSTRLSLSHSNFYELSKLPQITLRLNENFSRTMHRSLSRSFSFSHVITFSCQTRRSRLLTMSMVTSPTFVAPCALRKFLTRSCSFGTLSARIALRSVLSDDALRIEKTAGQHFCKGERDEEDFQV